MRGGFSPLASLSAAYDMNASMQAFTRIISSIHPTSLLSAS